MREPLTCARCGAQIEGEQSWCTECGLAARTRMAPAPNWRAPLVAAGAVGLAAIVALIVAFLVLTGDNAPLPTTAAPAATVPPVVTTTTAPVPATSTPTTPGTVPTTTVPAGTVPTTPAIPATTTAVPTTAVPTTTVPTTQTAP